MSRHIVCVGAIPEVYLRKEGIKALMHLLGSATASVVSRCIRASCYCRFFLVTLQAP